MTTDSIETIAARVIAGTATAEDVRTLATWTLATARWLKRRAPERAQ